MKQPYNQIINVLLVLVASSLLIIISNADLQVPRLVAGTANQWPGTSHLFWAVLYEAAPVPGLILAGSALVVFVAGFLIYSLKKFRRQTLFLVLLALLGPGLLVNVILKDHLGRPRPRELVEFGGEHHFVQCWHLGTEGKNSSFPSGHASIAFFVMAPWFIYRNNKHSIAIFFLGAGSLWGLLVGLGRIMQGAHFLSDILWAGGLVYITGEVLSWVFIYQQPDQAVPDSYSAKKYTSCREIEILTNLSPVNKQNELEAPPSSR